MAIIKKSALIPDISGKIQGSVFGRGKSANYVRNQSAPIKTNSYGRSKVKTRMQYVSQKWQTLTAEQVEAWNLLASNTQLVNRFGDVYNPSGYNLFVKYSINLLNAGHELLCTPENPQPFPNGDELKMWLYDEPRINTKSFLCTSFIDDDIDTQLFVGALKNDSNENVKAAIAITYPGLKNILYTGGNSKDILKLEVFTDSNSRTIKISFDNPDRILFKIIDPDGVVEDESFDITSIFNDNNWSWDQLKYESKSNNVKLKDQKTPEFNPEECTFYIVFSKLDTNKIFVGKLGTIPVTIQPNNWSYYNNKSFDITNITAANVNNEYLMGLYSFIVSKNENLDEALRLFLLGYYQLKDSVICNLSTVKKDEIIAYNESDNSLMTATLEPLILEKSFFSCCIPSKIRLLVGYDTQLNEGIGLQLFVSRPHNAGVIKPFSECLYVGTCEDPYTPPTSSPWPNCDDGYHECPPELRTSWTKTLNDVIAYAPDGSIITVYARYIDLNSGRASNPILLKASGKKKPKFKAGSGLSDKTN